MTLRTVQEILARTGPLLRTPGSVLAVTLMIAIPLTSVMTAVTVRQAPDSSGIFLSVIESLVVAAVLAMLLYWLILRPLRQKLAASTDRHLMIQAGCQVCAHEFSAEAAEVNAANHAKSQFIATVSHELRTPLNAIIGFSQIIRDDTPRQGPNAIHADFAQEIYASGVHLLSLINEMLELACAENDGRNARSEPVDLRQILAGSARLVANQIADAGLSLSVSVMAGAETVTTDQQMLRQVLNHLLSNAIKFTPPGGGITLNARRDGDHITLSVRDTGIGMPAEDLERAFQPFWQAAPVMSRRNDGAGLGLPLVRSLAERMNGAVEIASQPGQGTTVSLVLPLRPEANMTSFHRAGRTS